VLQEGAYLPKQGCRPENPGLGSGRTRAVAETPPSPALIVLSPLTSPWANTDMPSSRTDSSQELKYPPVRINHSLTKLDLDTLMMRSTTPRTPEEAGSALDDSTYELLTKSTDSLFGAETSDDDAHTESIASTDGTATDDVSEFGDHDDDTEDSEDYGRADTALDYSITSAYNAPAQPYESRPSYSTGDSTLTEVPEKADSAASRWIRLDEQLEEETGVINGSHVIKNYPDKDGVQLSVFEEYRHAKIRLVVKAALSHAPMPTPSSYAILLIGMPEPWEVDVIKSKINAALNVTSHSVPPPSQLLKVDYCTRVQISADSEGKSSVAVSLKDGTQLIIGSGRTYQPDLVVVSHPAKSSSTDKEEFALVREVIDREKIPCLNLVQATPYREGSPSYNSKDLSLCVEGRRDPDAEFALIEVLPLTSFTFSELDPVQINRHLALVGSHLSATRPRTDTIPLTQRFSDKGRAIWKDICGLRLAQPRILLALIALTGMISGCLLGPSFIPLLLPRSNLGLQPMVSTPVSTSSSIAAPLIVTIRHRSVVSIPSPSPIQSAARGLTVVPPQPKPRAPRKIVVQPVGYGIQTTTDHQFTLIPSKELADSRKKPQLQIKVSRESDAVQIRFNRTISGVYVVDLEERYPFGRFNVSIASYSKPLLQQSFQIDMGYNVSSIAQRVLDSISSYEDLLAGLTDLEVAALTWTKEALQSGAGVVSRLQFARKNLEKIRGTAWSGVRKATAPVRTSESMLRARTNALQIRCKMEMAAGLSSRGLSGRQSWACSKVAGQS
jgi:hypothetical protein